MPAVTHKSLQRYIVFVVVSVVGLLVLFSVFYRSHSDATPQISGNTSRIGLSSEVPSSTPHRRANATIVMLARNDELENVVFSMHQLEDRFNRKYRYPWVFLNDMPFTDEFKERTSLLTDAKVSYGLIPRENWVQPDWIDEDKAMDFRHKLTEEGVLYGGSVSYRNMCRFNSGYFYRHELLKDFRYYWRVEPDVKYYCDLDYDPFLYMQDEKKVYGFTMSMYETAPTIPTLWDTTKDFIEQNPQYLHPDNALKFLSDDNGETYNLCHFWSNFEIADMDFWRSEAYSKYFDHLDQAGGFYYERWGDAPVHSIAAGLFLSKDKLHFFSDIGYKHSAYQRCPQGEMHKQGRCWCNPDRENFDYDGYSCLPRFENIF